MEIKLNPIAGLTQFTESSASLKSLTVISYSRKYCSCVIPLTLMTKIFQGKSTIMPNIFTKQKVITHS